MLLLGDRRPRGSVAAVLLGGDVGKDVEIFRLWCR